MFGISLLCRLILALEGRSCPPIASFQASTHPIIGHSVSEFVQLIGPKPVTYHLII